jgi:predicted flap endonuclease-1-like 5' DNA nuclease
MAKIETIEGIGPAFQEKLAGAGVTTVEGLLESGASDSARATLAEASSIPQKRIDTWVSMADLMRLAGVGGQFAELMVRSGVNSVANLASMNGESLRSALETENEAKNMVKKIPSVDTLNGYIQAASHLDDVQK